MHPITISEKLRWLEERYWRLGQDEMIEDHLEDLFEVDDQGNMTSKPRIDPLTGETKGVMLLAESGCGKTAAVVRLLRTSSILTAYSEDQPGNTLLITVPPSATLKKLGEIGLKSTGYDKVDARIRAADAWEIFLHRLELLNIKLVIIDECHHMLQSGSGKDIPTAIQSLKHIMQSKSGVALMVAGVPVLRDAIKSEPSGETYRRLSVCELPRIHADSRFARNFAENFRVSADTVGIEMATEDRFAERILFAAGGKIGPSVSLGKEILRNGVRKQGHELCLERADRVYRKITKMHGRLTPFQSTDWAVLKTELDAMGWAA
jgi:hypothetical protein